MPLTGVPGRQQYLATLLYKFGRTPAFWQAVAAQTAGTATPGQITLVQQANGSFGVPATKTGGFLKVVGGVGTAVTGYSIGSTIGHATLELVGFDADGAVCENTTGVVRDAVAVLTGADCSAFTEIPAEFVPNEDVEAGQITEGLCLDPATATTNTTVFLNPAANATWSSLAALPITPCSAGQLLWSPVSGDSSVVFTPSGYVQLLSVAQTGPRTVEAVIERHDYGTVTGGQTVRSRFYAICLNSGQTGALSGSGGSRVLDTLSGGTITQTFSGSGTCNGFAVYVDSSKPSTELEACGGGSTCYRSRGEAYWVYKPGATIAPVVIASGDPQRVLRCVVVHSGGTLTRDSATFRESDGVIPQVLCPDVEGLTVESIEIREVNLEDGSWLTLWSESTTAEYQAAIELAPECSNGTCLLDLRKDSVGSCFQSPTECAGWFADPDKGSKYSCHYGSHAVDLAECTIYAPTFQPGATTTGNVYGDPETGAVVPSPATLSGSDPDGSGQACWPSGWSVFNPLEWVFRPIVCAFTPSQAAVVAVQTRIDTAISTSQPGTIANTIAAADWSGITSGGCQGVLIDMTWLRRDAFADVDFPETLTIANACPGSPLEPYALFSSVIVAGGVIMACIKTWPALLGRIFNYGGVNGS